MKRSFVFCGAAIGALSLLLSGGAADERAATLGAGGSANSASYADYARFEDVATQELRSGGGAAVNNRFIRDGDNLATRFAQSSADSFSQIVKSEVGLAAFQNHLHRQLTSDYEFDAGDWAGRARARIESTADALPLRAADTLTDALLSAGISQAEALRFVREVEASYQSELGGRKWQAGVGAVGSLQETKDNVFAWQLRGFSAQDSTTGANAGLIYRSVVGNALWGGNVFLDFEDGEYGEFWRWSLGLESKTKVADFYINHYVPITSDRALSGGRVAYSKQGWDAGLGLHFWESDIFSGGLEYYNFQGEYGQADDRGLRGFVEARPPQVSGLQLRVEYDDDSGDFGGSFIYRHRLDSPANSPAGRVEKFNPRDYFYAPVRREWSHRIGVATLVTPLGFVGGATQGIALAPPLPARGGNLFTITVQGGDDSAYTFDVVPSSPQIVLVPTSNSNEVIVRDAGGNAGIVASETDGSFEIRVTDGAGDTATLTFGVSFNIPEPLVFAGGSAQTVILETRLVTGAQLFTITVSGGSGSGYRFATSTPQLQIFHSSGSNEAIIADAGVLAAETNSSFNIQVTDGDGNTANFTFEVEFDLTNPLSRMVLIGGGLKIVGEPSASPLSDAWRSVEVTSVGEANGATWEAISAPAGLDTRVGYAAAVLGNRIFVIGGNTGTYSDVHSCGDDGNGIICRGETNSTLPALINHGALTMDGTLFVVGGSNSNDVWATTDGTTWTRLTDSIHSAVTNDAESFALVEFNNKLYLIGGEGTAENGVTNTRVNWVWESDDGITWRSPNPSHGANDVLRAAFPASFLQAVAFQGTLFVVGTDQVGNDVWWTTDGYTWAEMTQTTPFPVRVNHHVFALDEDGDGTDDAIYVVGGTEIIDLGPPIQTASTNTVFRSTDGATWTEVTQTAPFTARSAAAAVLFP